MARHSIGINICIGGTGDYSCSDGTANIDCNNWRLLRDTSDASRGLATCDLVYDIHGDTCNYSTRGIGWFGIKTSALGNFEIPQHVTTITQGANFNYTHTWANTQWAITAAYNKIGFAGYFTWNKEAGQNWLFMTFEENLADEVSITAPQGLSVSFPSDITGNITASLTAWGKGNPTPMTGTPTTYPNAVIWNFAANLFNEDGTYTGAGKKFNTGETKSCDLGSVMSGWSTNTGVLTGSAAASAAPYSLQPGKKYYVVVYARNSFNQEVQVTSGLYMYYPEIGVKITSCVYDPTTKTNTLTFTYTKEEDNSTIGERLRYDIYDDDTGQYLKTNVEITTVYDGRGLNGSVTVTGLPTGHKFTVALELTIAPNLDGANVRRVTDSVQAPVANAAFLGFDWDELRRTCTIRAEAPGAANCRIQAGYQPNVYDIGNKLTTGEVGELVVKDLNHGTGQILYLQATPESSSGYQYLDEVAKISIPIPNPIIGLVTPSCEDEANGAEQKYIVDIVEHKTNNTCTPRWQNGDRVVKKDPCS